MRLPIMIIVLMIALATTAKADCIVSNSTSIVNVSSDLTKPFYTITFDDLGFRSSGWGWIYSSQGPLHITHGQQNITLSGATCRVWNGRSGFYTTSWDSSSPWQGDTSGTVGDFMIVGSDPSSGNCLFEVSPPISAFTMRLSSTPAPSSTYIEVFDADGTQIDCITSLPNVPGTNGYSIIGVYSNTLISSFSAVVGSTGLIQADNIQLLTCSARTLFNGTDCAPLTCMQQNSCSPQAYCNDTDTGYECSCMNGYSGDGLNCTDADECLTGSPCSQNATCQNTEGSFNCTCVPGYYGNGFGVDGCQLIHEPTAEVIPQSANSPVLVTPNSPPHQHFSYSTRIVCNALLVVALSMSMLVVL